MSFISSVHSTYRLTLYVAPIHERHDLLRTALRCIRLQLYTPEEAEYALAKAAKHLKSWDGPTVASLAASSAAESELLASVLQKDVRVIAGTGQMYGALPSLAANLP
jgi:hypothetical protein